MDEENEKLKKEIKELKHNLSGVDDYSRDLLSQLTKLNPLKEENEKLKKEIKEQKEEYEDDMLSYETLIGDITEHQDYQELIDEHEFEMDKLEEKNKDKIIFLQEHYDEWKNHDVLKFLKKNHK